MATKIRLQRRGHKDYAFYSIVIADARAPRDGKFIEKIGTYNPRHSFSWRCLSQYVSWEERQERSIRSSVLQWLLL